MKKIINICLFSLVIVFAGACSYQTDKLPYPIFEQGAHFITTLVPEPNPLTAANVATLRVSVASASSSSLSFKTQSLNADQIEKIDVFVAHRRGAVSTPAISPTAPHGVLFKTITSLGGTESYSVSEMISMTKIAATDLRANDLFALKFVATMKDGRVFSADNSGPGINVNPIGTTFRTFLFVNMTN